MLIAIVVLALLLLLNGVFAMAELAMMTSRQSRLQRMAGEGSRGAATALVLAREPTRFLSTVQVGITMIGILSGAFGEQAISGSLEPLVARVPGLADYADRIAMVIVVLVITYFSLVVGELVPKRIAMAFPEQVASTIARPLNAISRAAAWPVHVLAFSTEAVLKVLRVKPRDGDEVSEDDVRALVARAASTGIFTPHEHQLFKRIMRLGDLAAGDLIVPRQDIVWIDEDEPIDAVRVLIGTSPHSHFPVCRADLDHLTGVVHIKDLISYGLLGGRDFKVSAVAQKPVFVPETMPALKLLDLFQSSGMHIAFVVDEYGGTQGLITINDVTAALVGNLRRTGDTRRPLIAPRGDGSWLLDGRLPIHELFVSLSLPPEAETGLPDVSTVGGLVPALLGHIPREGETVVWQGWRFEVVDMDGARVDKLIAARASAV